MTKIPDILQRMLDNVRSWTAQLGSRLKGVVQEQENEHTLRLNKAPTPWRLGFSCEGEGRLLLNIGQDLQQTIWLRFTAKTVVCCDYNGDFQTSTEALELRGRDLQAAALISGPNRITSGAGTDKSVEEVITLEATGIRARSCRRAIHQARCRLK